MKLLAKSALSAAVLLCLTSQVAATPEVFWASDPVLPGQTVVVIGEGFGAKPKVLAARLPDQRPAGSHGPSVKHYTAVDVIQASDQGLKFTLPKTFQPGIFEYRIVRDDGGMCADFLNRPQIWWTQGDAGANASPGGWIRVFGKNLGVKKATVAVDWEDATGRTELSAQGDEFGLLAQIPRDLKPGRYELLVHNEYGYVMGGSEPVRIEVAKPTPWPATVFNVRECGAEGDGVKDDSTAILAALEKAAKAGGGVVYFPRGRYRVSEALPIPRFTMLRGEKREWSCLAFTDLPKPPESLVHGTNSFGIEELTLYAKDHRHVIVGDLGDKPGAGDVFLRGVRVRADVYRGHPKQEEVQQLFAGTTSWGGGATVDTVRLGGKNVEITDCDFYGSGRAIYLKQARGARVEGNKFYNGRWGWYCLEGCDGLIFAKNELTGGDLMSTGGGIANYSTSSSQNIYFAQNRMSLTHGWDREIMTTDAGDGAFFGRIKNVDGTKMTLEKAPERLGEKAGRDWRGAAVFILDGKGAGQYRRLVKYHGDRIEIDRPWQLDPDTNSVLSITMFHGRYLLVGNEFTDTGAVQFYGTSIDCVVARNKGTRMQGFRGMGLWYYAYQPSWFCQFLDNEILEGNYYHFSEADDSLLEIFGAKQEPYRGPLNVGAVVRGNQLHGQSHIRIAGTCRDAVVEGNLVANADRGIFVSRDTTRVLVKDNRLDKVTQPILDEIAEQKAAEAKLARFLGRKEPVAIWGFDERLGEKFLDTSGNGFTASPVGQVAVVDGVRGKAIRLDGTSYLRVAEPAVFNAPELTVSLWLKPEQLKGRRGIVGKRFGGTGAPWIISHNGPSVTFEASTHDGKWPWNFQTGPVLSEKTWNHVAVVLERNRVTIYVNGKIAASLQRDQARAGNGEPVIIGREAWGGDPPKGDTPGLLIGCLDEIRIWTRALPEAEIRTESAAISAAERR
jgi:hypothetical protein